MALGIAALGSSDDGNAVLGSGEGESQSGQLYSWRVIRRDGEFFGQVKRAGFGLWDDETDVATGDSPDFLTTVVKTHIAELP